MELTLNSYVDAPSGFPAALRHRMWIFQTNRRHHRDMKILYQLPNHVLHDIGLEELITHHTSVGPYGY